MDPIIIFPQNPNCCSIYREKGCIATCVVETPVSFFSALAEALGL